MHPQSPTHISIPTISKANDHNHDLHLDHHHNLDQDNNLDLDQNCNFDQDHDQNCNLDQDYDQDRNLDLEHNYSIDQDHDQDGNLDHDLDQDGKLDHDRDGGLDNDDDNNGGYILNTEPDPYQWVENNPPESFCVSQTKVTDWLDQHTFIERKSSVKFAISRNLDPTQTRSSHRSVPLNHTPKLSIIGFRKKPVQQTEGKCKQNDRVENVRLFRNRSEPGRDYCLLITEPVSPRVSCIGRVGSMRVQGRKAGVWRSVKGRKAGVWRSVKAVLSNFVQTSREPKADR